MRRILMTGCSTGVGATIRKNLQKQGHYVFGVGRSGPDLTWDFSDSSVKFLDRASRGLLMSHGPFDTLINNAGTTHVDFLEGHGSIEFASVLHINLAVPFALSRAFVRMLKPPTAPPYGEAVYKIINTGSMATKISMRGSPGYCASKAGLEALTRQMAKELAGELPISVVCIAPGTIENTHMSEKVIYELQRTRGMSESEARKYAMQSPMGRASTHDEVWRAFDFFVNHAPLYCSGTVLHMTGGMGV